jgi:uncharacterized glyoxalase superfamily protein PhnB
LRYRDIDAAIEWLADAFGFEEHSIAAELDGTIRHVKLNLGCDMIMLLPAAAAPAEGAAKQPQDLGGAEAQSLYFVVDDVEAHYRKAVAAGAEALEDGEYAFGGSGYSCRDPEGHVWHFGTFDPRLQEEGEDGAWIREFLHGARARTLALNLRTRLSPPMLVAAVVAAVVAIAAVGWTVFALSQTSASARDRGVASKALPAPQAEETGVRSLARRDILAKAVEPPVESIPAPSQTERAAEPAVAPRPADAERLNRPAIASPAIAVIEAPRRPDPGVGRAAQPSTYQTTEEVLGRLREARRPPAETGALRETPAAAAPQEGKDQATSSADGREQQAAREQAGREQAAKDAAAKEALAKEAALKEAAAKEAAAKETAARKAAERTRKEARSWSTETERVKPGPAEPKAAARRSPGPSADAPDGWECMPSPPSGQIVCHPLGRRRAPAKAASATARQQMFPVEGVAEPPQEPRQAPSLQPAPEQGTAAVWDCQPAAPDGQIVCRPR